MRTSHHTDHEREDLVARKRADGVTASLVLPARDEEATIARVLEAYLPLRDEGLLDEVLVVDSLSGDATAAVAREAGATVVAVGDVHPAIPARRGKGEALWRGVLASTGDIVVFADADVLDAGPHYVVGLLGPFLDDPAVQLVKGFYERPIVGADGAVEEHGGRVTELVARPLLSLFRPELARLVQPLAGEYAGRRSLLEAVAFPVGYGVEIALLLDAFGRHGGAGLAQVDLGRRTHRRQSQQQLGVMAAEVMAAALRRLGLDPTDDVMHQFAPEGHGAIATALAVDERPPIASL
ncbi:glucosyl-3-phosphoglycerate synthase [Iamia sp. SCSIO 61187]|uniref:glucosyl-3-phosphoglycerate synthase n=1 Tax=Iamia sp. SCSIO 61187 TaxID=2722752 RepID=UPI001C62C4DF|nr:glucosyl-3-phosphoglycerate synthase [Iamia sp. SCSIO 61187]